MLEAWGQRGWGRGGGQFQDQGPPTLRGGASSEVGGKPGDVGPWKPRAESLPSRRQWSAVWTVSERLSEARTAGLGSKGVFGVSAVCKERKAD